MIRVLPLLIVPTILFVGCREKEKEGILFSEDIKTVEQIYDFNLKAQEELIRKADPIFDAEVAFKNGDHRLVALMGIPNRTIPGLTEPDHSGFEVKSIQGTDNAVRDEAHRIFMELSREYAEKYNIRLIQLFTISSKL